MRIVFDENNIRPGLLGVVLLSHGTLAEGLMSAASIVFGDIENMAAFCLEPGDDLDAFRDAFARAVGAFATCVVLVDMKGGTPCNLLLRHARENHLKLNAVTGANLSMLLEILGMRDDADPEELCRAAVEAAQTGVVDLSAYLRK
ncbi:hypothetical protein KQI82_07465 [Oscillibacter sp. MSJ-2]|uniref:PTS EIIA type-4 domain-containing protein n=1 Tax=Dysosmobacter acutus TaxID=2841504 RepID=A0ABS6F8Y4_9FIRM|nr:hypothetical protein [Dysosmobacter acutus]MBU5626751.1 hypothetical protein [Dysosmobacter acutus]